MTVPTTDAAKERGLQGFPCPDATSGMVFTSNVWPREEEIPMWIATVSCPLGVLWVSASGGIVGKGLLRPRTKNTLSHIALYALETDPKVLGENVVSAEISVSP